MPTNNLRTGGCSWPFFAYYSLLIILGILAAVVNYMWIVVIVLWLLPFVYVFAVMVCGICSSTTATGDEQRNNPPIAAAHQPPNASFFAAIPAFVYEKTVNSSGEGGGSDGPCSVCLESVRGGEMVRKLPVCEHMFHVECIDMWLGTHSTCPNCRSIVGPPEAVRTVDVDDPPVQPSRLPV